MLADRLDCRSRQAAFGSGYPSANSTWIPGLAHPARASGERKRVGSRLVGGKAARTVAGTLRQAKARLACTCRGKALRATKVRLFDEGRAAAVLVLRLTAGNCGSPEGERERQRLVTHFARGRKRRGAVTCQGVGLAPEASEGRYSRSWRCAVIACLHPEPGCRKAVSARQGVQSALPDQEARASGRESDGSRVLV